MRPLTDMNDPENTDDEVTYDIVTDMTIDRISAFALGRLLTEEEKERLDSEVAESE